jgi:antitoxin FitA
MPTITVKNIPEDLYQHLKEAASTNRRSINSEIIVCIERSLRSQKIDTEETLRRARQLREQTKEHPITDAQITKAKAAGRL